MLWLEAIRAAEGRLTREGIPDAELNAVLLAVHLKGGWKRSDIDPYLQDYLTVEEAVAFEHLIHRRLSHEPLQHITGETEFYGLRLYTSADALIPRPDTEILVEETLEVAKTWKSPRVLDIGTGTGAIALAIASSVKISECIGIDKSEKALALANRNKERLVLANVSFACHDIFSDVSSLGSFDIVVSNPPYISTKEYDLLDKEVSHYEPRIALTDESDGLISKNGLLGDGGWLLFEVGFDTGCDVASIMKKWGFREVELVNDLSGIGRVVKGRKYCVTNTPNATSYSTSFKS
jgi:release factor glutamine methyltransferase